VSKFLKVVGIGCGGCLVLIVACILIAYVMLPDTTHVERQRVIDAPIEVVFPLVDTVQTWEKWDPWNQLDPNMDHVYEGPPAGVGAISRWSSEDWQVGVGWTEITESVTGQLIVFDLHMTEEEMYGVGTFTFTPVDDGVQVKWAYDADLTNFSSKMFGPFMDQMLGAQFDIGLKNLEQLAETRAAEMSGDAMPVEELKEAVEQAVDAIESATGDGE